MKFLIIYKAHNTVRELLQQFISLLDCVRFSWTYRTASIVLLLFRCAVADVIQWRMIAPRERNSCGRNGWESLVCSFSVPKEALYLAMRRFSSRRNADSEVPHGVRELRPDMLFQTVHPSGSASCTSGQGG